MSDINYLALDGRSLRTFLVVLEEGSVSSAAQRLGVTQSAVSHTLVKLRLALGDPLFVRSGRGITPTERAVELQQPARQLLDDLKGLTNERVFDPEMETMEFTIAANDHQRTLLFPSLLQNVRDKEVDLTLHFVPSGIPAAGLLNEARCQFIVTPFPPNGTDIFQQRLFSDHPVCFYDPGAGPPPVSQAEFLERDLVVVQFDNARTETVLQPASKAPHLKRPFCSVPNFGAVAEFVRNTKAITIGPSLMKRSVLHALETAPLPFESKPVSMYLVWHRRDHADPAHHWMRERIKAIAHGIKS